MDEVAARQWLIDELDVSRETLERLNAYVALLRAEAGRQNLVSATTLEHIFARHIVDSAQLALHAPRESSSWLDLGSGAGLPGLVLAILNDQPMTLVESRRLRSDWLAKTAETLALENVTVAAVKLEAVPTCRAAVITARAFAPLARLLALAHRFADSDTIWLLPKGRSAAEELASVRTTWHGAFDMKTSVTDPDSAIIVARNVRPARRERQ